MHNKYRYVNHYSVNQVVQMIDITCGPKWLKTINTYEKASKANGIMQLFPTFYDDFLWYRF